MKIIGNIIAILGIALFIFAILGRFKGAPTVLGFQATNLVVVSIAVMVIACLAKLEGK